MSDLAIGAALALLGVLVAQLVAMIQARLERQHKREILLRTKYEELGMCFLASMKLPEALLLCETHEQTLTVLHQTEANKAHLLALVYFPQLRQATGRYIESYSALCASSISLYDPQDKRVLGMQVFNRPEYIAARNAHLTARDGLQDQIQIHSVTYAKS